MIHLVTNQTGIATEDYTYCDPQFVIDYFKEHVYLEVDTETKGFDFRTKRIISLQLGDPENQFVIDVRSVDILLFKDLILSKICIFHNFKFDYKFLKHAGITIENVWCTFIAEVCLFRGIKDHGYGLDKVGMRYLGVDIPKDDRGGFYKLEDEPFNLFQIRYAAGDVKYLTRIMKKQIQLAKILDLEDYIRFECEAIKVHADMEMNGLLIDVPSWMENAANSKGNVLKIELELDEILLQKAPGYRSESRRVMTYKKVKSVKKPVYGLVPNMPDLFEPEYKPDRLTEINWASDEQVAAILQLVYGIDLTNLKGEISTNSKVLLKYDRKYPIVAKLLKHREMAKEVSTYGVGFIEKYLHSDNRVRTSFWQIRDTGRSSSGSKFDSSPNVQNIPPDTHRKFFIARPGWKFITADFSQQEPRVLADKCQDPILLDFVLNGDGDSHSLISTIISPFFFDGKEVKVNKENNPWVDRYNTYIRQIGKIINLGLDYGKTAFSIKDDLQCTTEEAEALVSMIKNKFKGKQDYFNKVIKASFKTGYILTDEIYRSKTFLPQLKEMREAQDTRTYAKTKGEIERLCQNYPIQGTAALMTKLALVNIRKRIMEENLQAEIVNVVHDEIDLEAEESIAEYVANMAAEEMSKAGKVFCKTVPQKAELAIGDRWMK